MKAMKEKIRTAKVGPDKEKPKRSDQHGGRKNKVLNNESQNFARDMPGGGMRISNGSLPK